MSIAKANQQIVASEDSKSVHISISVFCTSKGRIAFQLSLPHKTVYLGASGEGAEAFAETSALRLNFNTTCIPQNFSFHKKKIEQKQTCPHNNTSSIFNSLSFITSIWFMIFRKRNSCPNKKYLVSSNHSCKDLNGSLTCGYNCKW